MRFLPDHRSVVSVTLLAGLLALLGCETQTRVLNSTWTDSFGEIADRKPSEQEGLDPNDPRVRSPQGYSVQLARFSGADASANAFELSAKLREQAGLADVWSLEAGQATTVYAGRFRDPREDRAKAMLGRVRSASIDGTRPFTDARLVPLSESGGGEIVFNEYDLRNHAGRITLQIGFYDGNYGPNFRSAAETAVDVLREQGEDAYFYHGPNRSLVTVGLFTRAEALVPSGQTEAYSPAVRALQERFPHNLMNGNTLEVTENGRTTTQSSFLVPVR